MITMLVTYSVLHQCCNISKNKYTTVIIKPVNAQNILICCTPFTSTHFVGTAINRLAINRSHESRGLDAVECPFDQKVVV